MNNSISAVPEASNHQILTRLYKAMHVLNSKSDDFQIVSVQKEFNYLYTEGNRFLKLYLPPSPLETLVRK